VTIAAQKLGRLVNRMMPTDQCEAWSFGAAALMRNLARRRLLA
jgi:fumarylacetoacetate (FAA) hydrolase family protein